MTIAAPALYYMPLFKTGTSVQLDRRFETVSHVMVRRNALMVYLVGHDEPVHPDKLTLAPTAFSMVRTPDQFSVL